MGHDISVGKKNARPSRHFQPFEKALRAANFLARNGIFQNGHTSSGENTHFVATRFLETSRFYPALLSRSCHYQHNLCDRSCNSFTFFYQGSRVLFFTKLDPKTTACIISNQSVKVMAIKHEKVQNAEG